MKWKMASILAAAAVVAGLIVLGCSDDKSTNPPPGGNTTTFNSGTLAQNAQFTFTFPTAGSFPYHCNFHSSMHGTIVVAAGGADSLNIDIQSFAFVVAGGATTLKPGGKVRWTNLDSSPHTATSD